MALEEFNKLFKIFYKKFVCLKWNLFSLMFSFIKEFWVSIVCGNVCNLRKAVEYLPSLFLQIQENFCLPYIELLFVVECFVDDLKIASKEILMLQTVAILKQML